MKLIFLGKQGSGKGTQGKIIADKLGIFHISTGDLLRSATGKIKLEIDSYINKGNLVPDELIFKILKERLHDKETQEGFILDGFPRNLEQAKELEKITKIDKVVDIDILDNEAVKRLSARWSCPKCKTSYNYVTSPKPKKKGICDFCNISLIHREDDKKEAIRKRLEIYHRETEPLLVFYKNILVKINGKQEINKVTEYLLKQIK